MYLAFYFLGFFLSVFCFTKEESLSNTKSIFIFIFFHFCEEGENSDARDNVGFVSAGLSATRYPLDGADVPSVRNILMFFYSWVVFFLSQITTESTPQMFYTPCGTSQPSPSQDSQL